MPNPAWTLEDMALKAGTTLDKAIEAAHPEVDDCALTNLKVRIHQGRPDQPTQLFLQQQLQRQNNQRR